MQLYSYIIDINSFLWWACLYENMGLFICKYEAFWQVSVQCTVSDTLAIVKTYGPFVYHKLTVLAHSWTWTLAFLHGKKMQYFSYQLRCDVPKAWQTDSSNEQNIYLKTYTCKQMKISLCVCNFLIMTESRTGCG